MRMEQEIFKYREILFKQWLPFGTPVEGGGKRTAGAQRKLFI